MIENHEDSIPVYTSGISNLVTITAAGLAASTALMQIVGSAASNKWWYVCSLVAFFVGLIFCFLTMSGLTGQAKLEKPNIDILNIRLPALISFCLACLGFILLGMGAFSAPETTDLIESTQLIQKLEACRGETGVTIELRLKCFDALVDSQISGIHVTNEELQSLPEKDRTWIKLLILKTKNHE